MANKTANAAKTSPPATAARISHPRLDNRWPLVLSQCSKSLKIDCSETVSTIVNGARRESNTTCKGTSSIDDVLLASRATRGYIYRQEINRSRGSRDALIEPIYGTVRSRAHQSLEQSD